MAISSNVQQLEKKKFVESTTTPGQPVVAISNPDGTPVASTPPSARTNYASPAAETSKIIKAAAGNLRGVTMSNPNAAVRFLQVHNSPTAPADTAVPFMTKEVSPNTVGFIDFGPEGVTLGSGIYVCSSTTMNTKTITATAEHLFNAQDT